MLNLVLARETEIFDMSKVEDAYHQAQLRDPLAKVLGYYEDLLSGGNKRFCSRPSSASCLDSLFDECPNFEEVLTDLRRLMTLTLSGSGRMNVLPLMLLGDAGVGKTYFAKRLAKVLGTRFEFVSMNTATAGWLLTGASASWKESRPGAVSEALVRGTDANPVMLVDELDKASGDAQSDPVACLYQLLEGETSNHFKDEYGSVEFDASNVVWVFTANDARQLPDPLLSRMAVYDIKKPQKAQARDIASRMYAGIRSELGVSHFETELGGEVAERLADVSPRLMRRALLNALGLAAEAGRTRLIAADVPATSASRNPMGFGH